ncbi:MAG: response regulator [Candidatus Latescibacteria bacterium]|nr:response regulator [Candidatus Latescibacterota bacterium]
MRIYLVDDEQIVTTTLQGFLAGLGHEVIAASSARELFEHLVMSSRPADLIISDLYMPDQNGLDLVREAHQRYPDVPIVLMTGYVPTFSPQEALAQGVCAYLRKPIHLGELELLILRLSQGRARV